jgi:WD40 repeat protein
MKFGLSGMTVSGEALREHIATLGQRAAPVLSLLSCVRRIGYAFMEEEQAVGSANKLLTARAAWGRNIPDAIAREAWWPHPVGIAVVLLALALTTPFRTAQAQSPEPVLRIEAETHTAQMRNAATDASGRILVTASEDKTARVWSLPDLRLLGVLRPPIGDGDEGKLNAVAVSADGRTAAVGGLSIPDHDTYSAYVFDLATRSIIRTIAGLPSVVDSIALAPDGRLAAGFAKHGIRVWRGGDLQFEDRDYGDLVNGLSFAPDGRLAAASFDGKVRLYDRNGHLLHDERTVAGKRPFRLRFSPDGTLPGVGFSDNAVVEVRDGNTLAPRARPDVSGLTGVFLANVGWSLDGKTLFSGGDVWDGKTFPIFSWDKFGAAKRVSAPGFGDHVGAIVPLPDSDGQIAAASMSGNIVVRDKDWTLLAEQRPRGADLRTFLDPVYPANRFRVAADGGVVEWVTVPAPQRLVRFDAARLDLRVTETETKGLTNWTPDGPGLKLTDWFYRTDPKLNGHPLNLQSYERALSASAGHNRLLLGADWSLRMFKPSGTQIWQISTAGNPYRVNQSPDGRLAIAALYDSTIRWYRADDGKELLAVYVTEDAQRWIAFTPSGYYAAAPGAEDLIGWHVNRGPDEAADFFSAGHFRDRFYRPDVVKKILATMDEAEALRQADAARGIETKAVTPIIEDLPPVVRIVSPVDGTRINGGEVSLEYTVRSPSGEPISAMTVLINGQRPDFAAVPDIPTINGKDRNTTGHLSVPVPPGKTVEIALLAGTTRDGEPARIRVTSASAPVDPGLPRLNGVLVGVSNYPIAAMKLKSAAQDVRDVTALFDPNTQHGQYRAVDLHVIDDNKATRGGILSELRALRDRNTGDDVVLIYFSGHGAQVGQRAFFLPYDVRPDDLDTTAISKADLLDILSDIKGTKLVFLDICHAGGFQVAGKQLSIPDMTLLAAEFSDPRRGLVVYASSSRDEVSEELPNENNGAFTSAVVEGLKGAAAVGRRATVSMRDLDVFVTYRVHQLTDGRQTAHMLLPEGVPNLPIIALARR